MAELKRCTSCGNSKVKSEENFRKSGSYYRGSCRECERDASRRYLSENRERERERSRAYNDKHKEERSRYSREYYRANKDVVSRKNRERSLKYYRENTEKVREYRELNRDRDRNTARNYLRIKRKNDPVFRFNCSVRTMVSMCISKNVGALRHLPYTRDELREHIERQFTKGMTWDNYGSYWHVDHIIPVSSFNITGPECDDFKVCWALTNLRPLKAEENLSKGDRITHLI